MPLESVRPGKLVGSSSAPTSKKENSQNTAGQSCNTAGQSCNTTVQSNTLQVESSSQQEDNSNKCKLEAGSNLSQSMKQPPDLTTPKQEFKSPAKSVIVRDPFDSDFNFEDAAEFKIELPAMDSFPNAIWQFGSSSNPAIKLEPPQNLTSPKNPMTSKNWRENETAEIMMQLNQYQSNINVPNQDPNKQRIKPNSTNQGPSNSDLDNDQVVSSTTQSVPERQEFYFALKHQPTKYQPQKIACLDFSLKNILPKQENFKSFYDSMPKLETFLSKLEPGLNSTSKNENQELLREPKVQPRIETENQEQLHREQNVQQHVTAVNQEHLLNHEQDVDQVKTLKQEPCMDQILEEKFKSENLGHFTAMKKEKREPLSRLDENGNLEFIRRNDREAPPPCNCFPDPRRKFEHRSVFPSLLEFGEHLLKTKHEREPIYLDVALRKNI